MINITRFRISVDVHLWVSLGRLFQRGLAEEGGCTLCGAAPSTGWGLKLNNKEEVSSIHLFAS